MQDFLQNRPKMPGTGGPRPSTGPTGSSDNPEAVFDTALLGALPAAQQGGGGHEISVEAIKEGERVTKLIVTCRCGERIEILCAYGPGAR